MKYPVIRRNFIPSGFKHSSVYQAIHIDFEKNEQYDEYVSYCKDKIIEYIDGLFIVTSPTLIQKEDRIVMIFRSNIDLHILKIQLKKVLQEVKYHTNNQITISYGLDKVLLLKTNLDANMFQLTKVGEDYENNEVYTKSITTIEDKIDHNNVNYLFSMEQYK